MNNTLHLELIKNEILLLEDFSDYNRFSKFQPIDDRLHVNERFSIIIDHRNNTSQHISEISVKATKTMGFLRRNLAFAPRHTKEVAYL